MWNNFVLWPCAQSPLLDVKSTLKYLAGRAIKKRKGKILDRIET